MRWMPVATAAGPFAAILMAANPLTAQSDVPCLCATRSPRCLPATRIQAGSSSRRKSTRGPRAPSASSVSVATRTDIPNRAKARAGCVSADGAACPGGAAQPAHGEKLYMRFRPFQRKLHLVLMISFFTLALTGMTLKFSYMGWAQLSAAVLGGFLLTGLLHRIAAVTLIGVFGTYLWDVRRLKKQSGNIWLKFLFGPNSAVFNKTDINEFIGSVKWFFGKGPRPNYGRFTYWEKFDYFAVFWGMFTIRSTGLILWFPEFFALVMPGWWVNVVTIIHSDEALLAVAFIFTIHFFNTHFRLDKLPTDTVMFTGRVPLQELKRDKADRWPYLDLLDRVFGALQLPVGLRGAPATAR